MMFFPLVACAFDTIFKKTVPSSSIMKIYIFVQLQLFKSLIYFELIICIWYEVGIQLHSSTCDCPVVQFPCVENTILCWLNGLGILVTNQLNVNVRVHFWALTFIPLIYVSRFMLVSHCFDYCSFVVVVENGKYKSFNCILLPDCFSILDSSYCLMNFRFGLSTCAKQAAAILIDYECIDYFGEYCHLNIVFLSMIMGCLYISQASISSTENVLQFLVYKFCPFLVKYLPKHFIFF